MAALGCCLFAAVGCVFDAAPNNTGKHTTQATSDSKWKPPSAADGGQEPRDAASEDAAADAMPSEVSVQTSSNDAGMPRMQPAAARDASTPASGGRGHRDMDASAPAQPKPSDAGKRHDSNDRDAQMASPKPDSSLPDGASDCRPGPYTGTFSGSIQLVGLSLSSVNGTVRAELRRDGSSDHMELTDGRVMGVDQDGNRLTVNLSGKVNCATDQLEDGKLTDGNFHNVDSDSDTPFIGKAEANYSRDPYSIVGTFTVEAKDSSITSLLVSGRGTWSLIRGN